MAEYRATFYTKISLDVVVEANDEDHAADAAWELAERYLRTVNGDADAVTATASLDGIGADNITEITED